MVNGTMSYEKWKDLEDKPVLKEVEFWMKISNPGNKPIINVSLNGKKLIDLPAHEYYYHHFTLSQQQITGLNTHPVPVQILINYNGKQLQRNYSITQNNIS